MDYEQFKRHPQLGGLTARYKHGVSSRMTPKPPVPVPAAPQSSSVEIVASKRSLKERLKRAKGVDSTNLTPNGSLTGTADYRSNLG